MIRKYIQKHLCIISYPQLVIFTQITFRHYWKNMDYSTLHPPASVRGMTTLDRNAFHKIISIPKLIVTDRNSQKVIPLIKKLLLKMDRLKPVRPLIKEEGFKEILLHPGPVTGWESLPKELDQVGVVKTDFEFGDLELSYENWRADEILKCVLPEDDEGLTSYSRVGHIVHINLRDHLQPYKALIGDVLKDKVPGCRTVVNKASTIDNVYRNFPIELICGEEDYQVEVKENGVSFEFDFSKVYWNPRLATEHERIVKILQPNDVLYDVFAGVGPFSVPAAKKRCTVLANDLNPESYKWLEHNAKKNKCSGSITTFNKDGREFILKEVRDDLIRRLNEDSPNYKIHLTMNLPALAVEFLDAYRGLIDPKEVDFDKTDLNYPLVHVYSFAKGENTQEIVQKLVEDNLGLPLKDNLQSISFVRNVAPNKDMYRVAFYLTKEILTTSKSKASKRRPSEGEVVEGVSSPKIPCS
ncbi:tRNA (guanine(37)-N1)-methyltransferase [Episyrphus balteatus]|uniref:tRNA (guanine(37)-N1)-methyltransferase n=1 Tax=Episyrphus balteatus TaxID=286459 RepID=UPI002486B2B4|nr:tRNA (guanine(37)-N1)-methyltransferase [Episyrphus balteatus]